MAILSEEQVSELQRRFSVAAECVVVHTPAQRIEKREKARAAREAKSIMDLDVQVQRYHGWLYGLQKLGVTVEWYEAKFAAQRGLCAICGRTERVAHKLDGTIKRLAVDHNHMTDQARGLLCQHCNTQLATLENTKWRQKAEVYLATYEKVETVDSRGM